MKCVRRDCSTLFPASPLKMITTLLSNSQRRVSKLVQRTKERKCHHCPLTSGWRSASGVIDILRRVTRGDIIRAQRHTQFARSLIGRAHVTITYRSQSHNARANRSIGWKGNLRAGYTCNVAPRSFSGDKSRLGRRLLALLAP